MSKEEYFEKVYASFWHNQVKKYGYTQYEDFALKSILKNKPKTAFEVGIGTGWPMAVALSKEKNVQISGCDISKSLIEEARENLKDAELYVGELFDLDIKKKFDLVYCFRTSWYIKDFYKMLMQMSDMTNEGGMIFFDIFDKFSIQYIKHLCHRVYNRMIWCGGFILGRNIIKQPDDYYFNIRKIKTYLKDFDIEVYRQHEILNTKKRLNQAKVMFVCIKKNRL